MKTGIFGIFLLGLAAAQPHRRHQELHQKRDIVTQTTFVTATAAEVIVYVDANGNPVRTEGGGSQTPPTPAPAPPAPAPPAPPAPPAIPAPPAEAPPVSPPVNEAPAPAPAPAPPAPPAAEPPAPAAPEPAPPAPPAPSVGLEAGFIGQPPSGGPSDTPDGFGISYSPYIRDAATNAPRCKTTDEINEDFDTIKSGGYAFARIYGVDCDQTEDVLNAAVSRGMKVMTGIYHVQDAENEVSKIIDALSASNADWKDIVTVGVGNEDVQMGRASVPEVLSALGTARSALRSNGYNGPVVHVDTVDATLSNPELCTASDYAAVNCHAFYDPNTPADQAGDFVQAQTQRVKNACNGANVSVMESGWPHAGDPNGKAIPSPENQKIAVESLKNSFKDKMMVLFSAFDDKWKEDRADTFGTERNWGMWGVGH